MKVKLVGRSRAKRALYAAAKAAVQVSRSAWVTVPLGVILAQNTLMDDATPELPWMATRTVPAGPIRWATGQPRWVTRRPASSSGSRNADPRTRVSRGRLQTSRRTRGDPDSARVREGADCTP